MGNSTPLKAPTVTAAEIINRLIDTSTLHAMAFKDETEALTWEIFFDMGKKIYLSRVSLKFGHVLRT